MLDFLTGNGLETTVLERPLPLVECLLEIIWFGPRIPDAVRFDAGLRTLVHALTGTAIRVQLSAVIQAPVIPVSCIAVAN